MGIAIYQIVGSLVIFLLIYLYVNEITPGVIFALIPILSVCLVSLMAGIFFFFKKQELRFFTLSKLNFCIQILQLSLPGFAFIFYYGPYLGIGVDGDPSFRLKFEMLTANFSFRIGETEEHYVLFNLVPLIPLMALRWIERNPVTAPALENSFIDTQETS